MSHSDRAFFDTDDVLYGLTPRASLRRAYAARLNKIAVSDHPTNTPPVNPSSASKSNWAAGR